MHSRGSDQEHVDERGDPSVYADAVRAYLAATDRLVDYVSEFEWDEATGHLEIVFRAVLRRQHEALTAILSLCQNARGDAAVPLLRPACEELILVTYLTTIQREQAQRLVVALAIVEIHDDLRAQQKFAGEDVMRELGFSARFVTEAKLKDAAAKEELAVLGRELGWKVRGRGVVPSVRFFAERTQILDVYDFLYHATSRFVHFKVKELFRRAWGHPPRLSVSSAHFAEHWTMFALYWGLWLHLHTTIVVLKVLEVPNDVLDENSLLNALGQLGGKVPLVTARELVWEGLRPPWE